MVIVPLCVTPESAVHVFWEVAESVRAVFELPQCLNLSPPPQPLTFRTFLANYIEQSRAFLHGMEEL